MTEIVRFRWLYYTSVAMFIGVLLLIPFNPIYATLLLFSLVGLWSRVPAMISKFTKDMEMLDFFTVIIAVNLGGWIGGVFGMITMLFSRIFAPYEWAPYTVKDSISFLVGGMLTPMIYAWTGGNLLITMYTFTVVRYITYYIITLILQPTIFMKELAYGAGGIFIAYVMNTILIVVLGEFTEGIVQTGIGFNLTLIVFVGLTLGIFWVAHYMLKQYKKDRKKKKQSRKPERVRGSLNKGFPFFGN